MELTNTQIEKGYWYYSPKESFPPEGKTLDEYRGEKAFNLQQTMGDESYAQINKREAQYTNDIPKLMGDVKTLWLSHINQNTFRAICQLSNLNALYIQSNKITDISEITKLESLEHLALLDLTKVEDISSLSELSNIRTLELENLKKVDDFSALSGLYTLEGLQIDGDMYTPQKINNFNFLGSLKNLKYLTLINTRAEQKDFSPLTNLKELEMFQCSQNYPRTEFHKLMDLEQLKYFGNVEKLIKNGC